VKSGSEATFQGQVIQLARTLGWVVYRSRYSLGADPGWPDLILVRRGQAKAWELKVHAEPSDEQLAWIAELDQVPGIDAAVLRFPGDWERIEKELR
jgi:hypothetical protein